MTTTTTCPEGHTSKTDDFCDTCGREIGAAAAPGAGAAEPAAASAQACPNCHEPITGRYCEVDGYDIELGLPAGGVVRLELSADRSRWEAMVEADGPAFPPKPSTATFELSGDEVHLGRAKPGRAIDIPIGGPVADPGVSAKQCTFRRTAAGWVVLDDDSANGTWINGTTHRLPPGTEHPLASGDEIGIGAWTVLRVEIS